MSVTCYTKVLIERDDLGEAKLQQATAPFSGPNNTIQNGAATMQSSVGTLQCKTVSVGPSSLMLLARGTS